MTAGVCAYCRCTEDAPCDGGCAWVDDTQTMCTTCFGAESIAQKLVEVLGAVALTSSSRVRLIHSAWEDLSLEQRQRLVGTCRQVVEMVSENLQDAMSEEAIIASLEVRAITGFLFEKCPEQLQDGAAVSHIVMRLLEPHVGSRIVLT